jgi:hypothetical protein
VSELTQWSELIAGVASAGAAVVAFLRGRRWAALIVAFIAAQCLATFIALRQNGFHVGSFVLTLTLCIAVLLLSGRARGEIERHTAARAESAADRRR